jgi:tetratricopeptide (TPR) repeat protein
VKALKLAPDQVELVRSRAETALGGSGSSAETAELYQLLVRIDPRDGMAWFNLGDALRTIGRLQESEEALLTAREPAPKARANA